MGRLVLYNNTMYVLVSWQLGLVEREINEILKGQLQPQQPNANARRLAKKVWLSFEYVF